MDPTKLRDWMEVIGIFALVASLIFVGLQMKQAQDIAIAEQYQVRAIYGAEHVGSYVENEHMLEMQVVVFKNAYESGEFGDAFKSDYEAFGPEYVVSELIMAGKTLVTVDAYYFQYQQGFMEEEAWVAFRFRFKDAFRDDYVRTTYLRDPDVWRESFQELCDALIVELRAETELTE
jgi:hypothetical protein